MEVDAKKVILQLGRQLSDSMIENAFLTVEIVAMNEELNALRQYVVELESRGPGKVTLVEEE